MREMQEQAIPDFLQAATDLYTVLHNHDQEIFRETRTHLRGSSQTIIRPPINHNVDSADVKSVEELLPDFVRNPEWI